MQAVLTDEQRGRLARSGTALIGMNEACAQIEFEVDAILTSHPLLNVGSPEARQRMRCVLWALVFSQLSQAAVIQAAVQKTETEKPQSQKAV